MANFMALPQDLSSDRPVGQFPSELRAPARLPGSSGDAAGLERLRERLQLDRGMVARSPGMCAIAARARQLAGYDVPVLVLGESGAGKEVIARLIHDSSPRRPHRFLKLNCAALPDGLLESELFGYESGAFTGATRSKPGHLELCHKGTLFLDEIGEMPVALQAKLLHVLQDHRYTKLGGRQELTADVRILAATNVDLPRAMAERRFREDLFFRLNVFSLLLPPLRERPEDVVALLEHFLPKFAEEMNCELRPLTPEVVAMCQQHDWPGNVRELEHFVKRFLIFGEQAWLDRIAISPAAVPAAPAPMPVATDPVPSGGLKELVHRVSSEIERRAIVRVLEDNSWNRTVAARVLNISYRALLNKVRLYNLYPDQNRAPHATA